MLLCLTSDKRCTVGIYKKRFHCVRKWATSHTSATARPLPPFPYLHTDVMMSVEMEAWSVLDGFIQLRIILALSVHFVGTRMYKREGQSVVISFCKNECCMVTYCMSRSEHNRDQCVTKLLYLNWVYNTW